MAYADNEDFRSIKNDIKQIKDDVRTMKHDLQSIKQSSSGTGSNIVPENVLQFLQHSRSPFTDDTTDISDTASTASIGSTGSEDESIKISAFRAKCLAEAIQRSFIDLMRGVPFEGMQDVVVSQQIITVVESERFHEFTSNSDKMRYLLRTVMRKDFDTMMKFVVAVGEYAPLLQQSVLNVYNERHKDGQSLIHSEKFCTACLIIKRVSVKLVCDHYFARGLISLELHKDATDLTKYKAHARIWQRLFHELSSERTEYVLGIMLDALKDGEGDDIYHHSDIIKAIERDMQRRRKSFKCRCIANRKRHITSGQIFVPLKRKLDFITTDSPFENSLPQNDSGLKKIPVLYGVSQRTSLFKPIAVEKEEYNEFQPRKPGFWQRVEQLFIAKSITW